RIASVAEAAVATSKCRRVNRCWSVIRVAAWSSTSRIRWKAEGLRTRFVVCSPGGWGERESADIARRLSVVNGARETDVSEAFEQRGSSTMKVQPKFLPALRAVILPPWRSINVFDMASPRPNPPKRCELVLLV